MMIAPRSYSVDDPGYEPDIGNRVRVTVDGDMIRAVTAYNCDEGWLDAVAHDERGNPVSYLGQFVIRRHHGKIDAVLV